MKVYGQLEAAAYENLSADPSAGVIGRTFWNTTSLQAKVDDGTNIRALLRNDQMAIIGNNGTANNNVRFHRGASSVLQLVLGGDATAEGTLSTNLAMLSTKFESYATGSIPAAGNASRLVYDTTLGTFKFDTGAVYKFVDSGQLLTTKGDLLTFSTAQFALPVGADSQVLTADSTQASGLKWTTPSNVAAIAIASLAGFQGVTSGGSPVVAFDTLEEETDAGSFTTGASAQFTCQAGKDGLYLVSAMVRFPAVSPDTVYVIGLFVDTGGGFTSVKTLHDSRLNSGAAQAPSISGTATIRLNAGDILQLQVNQTSGGTINIGGAVTENYICIARLPS